MKLRFGLAVVVVGLLMLIAAGCGDDAPTDPPPTVAIEQRPPPACGWEWLRLWRTSLPDWFADHEASTAVYWWRPGAGQFGAARRDQPESDQPEQLRLLHQGDLIWSEAVAGDPVTAFGLDDVLGAIQLRRGINLLSWVGHASSDATLWQALRWIAPSLISVTRWDREQGACRVHPPDEGDWTEITPRPGDLLALELREDATWAQPWAQAPLLLTAGDIGVEGYRELREELVAVVGFVAARYGVVAPVRVAILQTSPDAVAESVRLALNPELRSDWWPEDACGAAWDGGMALTIDCQDPVAVDHEYVHIVQRALISGEARSAGEIGPSWLMEGMASYIAARYRDAAGHEPYVEARRRYALSARIRSGSLTLERLETVEQWLAADPTAAYANGFLAAEWLAADAGEDALFDYLHQLRQTRQTGRLWRDAFEAAFGVGAAEFYTAFERHTPAIDPLPAERPAER